MRALISLGGDWSERASCKGMGVDIFFEPENVDVALNACSTCPVVAECDEWAREIKLSGAVAGGKWWPFNTYRDGTA